VFVVVFGMSSECVVCRREHKREMEAKNAFLAINRFKFRQAKKQKKIIVSSPEREGNSIAWEERRWKVSKQTPCFGP
jgi:hypothetical protein